MSSTPPSRATPVPERDEQLLAIGKTCSDPSCHLIDFLPFKCQHCTRSFCQDHFKVEAHKCPEYDETKHNRVAPDCPLCNTPVAIRPGQDPNVRMEEHFAKECSVMTGKAKAKSTPICAKRNCKKVLFSPIRCDKCRSSFCPAHRFPSDHACPSLAAKPITASSSSYSSSLAGITANAKNLNNRASAAGAAIKKSLSSPSASAPVSAPKAPISASTSKSSTSNPFSKTDSPFLSSSPSPLAAAAVAAADDSTTNTNTNTNTTTTYNDKPTTTSTDAKPKSIPPVIDPMAFPPRRVRAERESKRKAMQERARKGLLSEEEKAQLAAEEKEAAQTEGKSDCVVM